MEDALLAQLQNTSLEEHDDKDRIEAETDSEVEEVEEEERHVEHSKLFSPHEEEERVKGPQTGPKGVKADHIYQQQNKLVSENQARAEYNAKMLAKAPTTTTYAQDQQNKAAEEILVLEHEEEILNKDELAYYRRKRLEELKNLKGSNHYLRRQQKVFGMLTTIDMEEYPDEIDNEWKTIPVIVHLFDESLPDCRLLDDFLKSLAKKYTLAKFLRVSANDLEFDLVGSPAILAYQGGLLIANLVRIIDEVGTRFDVDSIEDILLRYGALSENDLYDLPNNAEDID